MSNALASDEQAVLDRLKWDTPFYAKACIKIVNKDREVVPLVGNSGQLALDRLLTEQREAGKPQRAIVLKARQIGFSTWTQAKLIQQTTMRPHRSALVVAHDKETAGKLFTIGDGMYTRLPDIETVHPPTRYYGRARFLHFGPPGLDAWQKGNIFPDSTYLVDTANEVLAGRGATYDFLHLSEVAFWGDPITKLTGLLQTVPRTPDSLVIIESTANGYNAFKDEWDRAVAGDSGFIPFFWPWWREASYSLPFINDTEREVFATKVGEGPYGDEEPELLDPGPPDPLTGERTPLTLEQLHWRRMAISNECLGRVEVFHQEYPATPEQAFLATGNQVFLTEAVTRALDATDAGKRYEARAGSYLTAADRIGGAIEIPQAPEFAPVEGIRRDPAWTLWLPDSENGLKPESDYLIGADASGGLQPEGSTEPDFHAAVLIDHKNREQVGQYRSRIDPDLYAQQLYLAARFFRDAWIAIEVTGGWGLPLVRRIYFDYQYPFVYIRRSHDSRHERQEDRLGWSTDKRTKPMMEANGEEMLREGSHGIHSADLCRELLTYVRDPETGKTGAEQGKHDDLVMAWLIAQQAANELPIKPDPATRAQRPGPTNRYR